MKILYYLLSIILIFLVNSARTKNNEMPDFSLIGDFRLYSHNDISRIDESEKVNLSDPEIELNISGDLNSIAHADIVFGWHGEHNAEIEEAYVTFDKILPLISNLRVGKYLLEFGIVNPIHPHAFPFIKRPLPHTYFFGEKGLSDMSVRAALEFSSGKTNTDIMIGLLKGDVFSNHKHEDEEHEELKMRNDLGFLGRLASKIELSESSNLALGASIVNAQSETERTENHDKIKSWLLGGDISYVKKFSDGKTLQILAEGVVHQYDLERSEDDSYGAYSFIDYQFSKKCNIGGIFEWIELNSVHEEVGEVEKLKTKITRLGLFWGYKPFEETSLIRVAGHWNDQGYIDNFWEMTVQLIINLGFHDHHNH